MATINDIQKNRKAAALGNSEAQYALGLVYRYGVVEYHPEYEVVHIGKRGTRHENITCGGNPSGLMYREYLHIRKKEIAKNPYEALRWFGIAAEQGHVDSQYHLGMMYCRGEGTEKNMQEAVRWLGAAANCMYMKAQYKLSLLYQQGEEVEKNEAKALYWLRAAAERGQKEAQYKLSLAYEQGAGMEKDGGEALRWLKLAAARGHMEARYKLGVMYQQKEYAESNMGNVLLCLLAAAEKHAGAQYKLGLIYRRGERVAADMNKAARWFRTAAVGGHLDAQYELGLMYYEGKGVGKSGGIAARMFREAAKQGHAKSLSWLQAAANEKDAEAQLALGLLYYEGKGVEQNADMAFRLFKEAAILGNMAALVFLGWQDKFELPAWAKELREQKPQEITAPPVVIGELPEQKHEETEAPPAKICILRGGQITRQAEKTKYAAKGMIAAPEQKFAKGSVGMLL